MAGALDGVKVLDFSTLLPGPMASLILAEAGAEVVKVERPEGEEMRHYRPRWGGESVSFALLNRGKQSLALDLKDARAREVLAPLIAEADVLIEQFRPGVMDRLGLGYEDARALNPDIVYCSITGYGQSGPQAGRAGHDLTYMAETGLLALSHGTPPVLPPVLVADIAGGTYPALVNILLALRARDAGKGGAHLDIAMAENLFPLAYWALGEGQATGNWPGNGDGLVTGGSPRYQLYPTADGQLLAAAPLEEKFWQVFCDAIGLDAALRAAADPEATRAAIARIIAAKPAAHWQAIFAAADCCCALVRGLEEALADAHFAARGTFARRLTAERAAEIAALPLPVCAPLAATPEPRAPALGDHSLPQRQS